MSKLTISIASALFVIAVAFGATLSSHSNPVYAESTSQYQTQLKNWEANLQQWEQQHPGQMPASQTNSATSTAMIPASTLPATGPSSVIGLFVVASFSGAVLHYSVMLWRRNRDYQLIV